MSENALTIEEAFEQLEQTIRTMESPELSLEEAFQKYQDGLKLVKYCNDSIEKIEQDLVILEENND